MARVVEQRASRLSTDNVHIRASWQADEDVESASCIYDGEDCLRRL